MNPDEHGYLDDFSPGDLGDWTDAEPPEGFATWDDFFDDIGFETWADFFDWAGEYFNIDDEGETGYSEEIAAG